MIAHVCEYTKNIELCSSIELIIYLISSVPLKVFKRKRIQGKSSNEIERSSKIRQKNLC
jgi:hypothetical protein